MGDTLCQRKKYRKAGGVFNGLLLAPEIKICLTIDYFGIIQEHKIFNGFKDFKRLLDRSKFLNG